jgi:hypothetical protein
MVLLIKFFKTIGKLFINPSVIYYFQKSHVKPLNSAINKLHWISPNSLELTDEVKSISETISVSQHLHFLPKLSGTLQWISVYQWIHWHFLIPLFFYPSSLEVTDRVKSIGDSIGILNTFIYTFIFYPRSLEISDGFIFVGESISISQHPYFLSKLPRTL